MAVEVQLKKWGNSIGIIIPREIVKERNLDKKRTILVEFIEKGDLTDVFGQLKTKATAQELKDLAREGWK